MRTFALTTALLALALPVTGGAATIDERQPAYQAYISALGDADRSVLTAIRALEAANSTFAMPGVDLAKMIADLKAIDSTLELVTRPEQKRMEYQTLIPEGTYFTSPATRSSK